MFIQQINAFSLKIEICIEKESESYYGPSRKKCSLQLLIFAVNVILACMCLYVCLLLSGKHKVL